MALALASQSYSPPTQGRWGLNNYETISSGFIRLWRDTIPRLIRGVIPRATLINSRCSRATLLARSSLQNGNIPVIRRGVQVPLLQQNPNQLRARPVLNLSTLALINNKLQLQKEYVFR